MSGATALDELTIKKVNDFVDDDLLSCFLWAAGENAVAQPGWESPAVNPLKGIPLPPGMPPLPPAGGGGGRGPTSGSDTGLMPPPAAPARANGGSMLGNSRGDASSGSEKNGGAAKLEPTSDDEGDGGLGAIHDLDDEDIEGIAKLSAPLSKEQKLMQRMQRKAESARVARLRKKDYVTGLEDEIKSLKAALAKVQEGGGQPQQQQQPSSSTDTTAPSSQPLLREESKRQISHMDELLKQPTPDGGEVNSVVERYVATRREQQETINDYLNSIEDILSPAAPLQVAFNDDSSDGIFSKHAAADAIALTPSLGPAPPPSGQVPPLMEGLDGADNSGGDEPRSKRAKTDVKAEVKTEVKAEAEAEEKAAVESVGSTLMGALPQELGLTPEQVEGLKLQRESVRADREVVAECMRTIAALRARVAEHTKSNQRTTTELRRILTPAQVAKFLVWVEKHHKKMSDLTTLMN